MIVSHMRYNSPVDKAEQGDSDGREMAGKGGAGKVRNSSLLGAFPKQRDQKFINKNVHFKGPQIPTTDKTATLFSRIKNVLNLV